THHRRVHAGLLLIEGRASTGFRFRHADGTDYGAPPAPADVALFRDVFLGLRGLGYGEKVVRQAIERVRPQVVGRGATAESVLRLALAELRPASRAGERWASYRSAFRARAGWPARATWVSASSRASTGYDHVGATTESTSSGRVTGARSVSVPTG